MANVEWTEEFEQKLRDKLESEYQQADNMVIWASRSSKPIKEGKGLVDVKKSANTLLKWIKTELGI